MARVPDEAKPDNTYLAREKAKALGIDDAVRLITLSGALYLGLWHKEWEGMSFSATFDEGHNSAIVRVIDTDFMLYKADDYGRNIIVFRYGPWTQRLLNRVVIKETEVERIYDNFEEVDF